jgi:thiamine pyrophosphate-dependent acetolactate synthase large subunit-like protein
MIQYLILKKVTPNARTTQNLWIISRYNINVKVINNKYYKFLNYDKHKQFKRSLVFYI